MTTSAEHATDQAAAAAVPKRIVAAWTDLDADAFAEVFTPDATMVMPGLYRKGREAIRTFMSAAFAGPYKGTQVVGEPIDVRFLSPDTAVLVTVGGVRPVEATEVADEARVRATWVLVNGTDGWQLAAYHNGPSGDV